MCAEASAAEYNFEMPRNAEVIRQWTILREIERARLTGVTIETLAELSNVTTRTIRRDINAIQEAGFPIYDDKSGDDGRTRWVMNGQAFRGLTTGLSVSELSALYFSRTLLSALAGTPFTDDLERAFEKLGTSLTPHMRKFLDQLPQIFVTKHDPMRRRIAEVADHPQHVARALEATLHHRQATLLYASRSSQRTKSYVVHPYRLAYAQGGLYLLAFVPEYGEVRTFAMERISQVSLLEETFTPPTDLPTAVFPHSLGVHFGPPERVSVAFDASVCEYVASRDWHPSQRWEASDDGGRSLTLDVCIDESLVSWILSFGPRARVVTPSHLVTTIAQEFDRARARYAAGV